MTIPTMYHMTPNKNQRHEASIGTAKNTGTFTCKSSMEGPFLEKHYGPPDEDNGTLPKNSPWNPNECLLTIIVCKDWNFDNRFY